MTTTTITEKRRNKMRPQSEKRTFIKNQLDRFSLLATLLDEGTDVVARSKASDVILKAINELVEIDRMAREKGE